MTKISIQEFPASYETTDENGVVEWTPCRVVGVNADEIPRFIILTADDRGVLWPFEVSSVKPTYPPAVE